MRNQKNRSFQNLSYAPWKPFRPARNASAIAADLALELSEKPQLCLKHLQEWRDSGVKDEIIYLNVISIVGKEAFDLLHPTLKRKAWRNTGRLTDFWMRRHRTVAETSGWWVSGINPVTGELIWGRYKPTEGQITDREKKKPAKYLSPAKTASRLICLQVDDETWQRVSERYGGIPIEECARARGFWPWVWKYNVPIILCEGEKKAGSLLSEGYAAISVPGIFSGFRRGKDGTRSLIPDLAHFDTPHRQIIICFDYESDPKKAKRVEQAAITTAYCFKKANVRIAYLPGPHKGVDDFLVAGGNFELICQQAKTLSTIKSERAWQLTAPVNLELNQRYLGELPFPKSGFGAIKSPKGTGKTIALQPLVSGAVGIGKKTLVIGHRIVLLQAICKAVGIPYITEVCEAEQGRVLGFGLCIDSCHPQGLGQINPEDWAGAIVIIDEVEQVLWHLLNSATCSKTRVIILKTFKALIAKVLSTGGLVIAQDADLSDYAVEFLQGCAGFPIQPWVCVNNWKPEQGWDVTFYEGQKGKKDDPSALLDAAVKEVNKGGKIFIACDAQQAKSPYSTQNAEKYIKAKCPDAKVLRIDSVTVGNPNHPAYNCAGKINEIVSRYDVVITSPTLATGISIDIRGHFTHVYGIFQGAISENEVRQALARVREPIPRSVWVSQIAVNDIGNGSDNYKKLVESKEQDVKLNCRLLKEADFDLDNASDPIALRTWAKQGARINISVWDFREQVKQGLIAEGHTITSCNAINPDTATSIREIKDAAWEEEAQAVTAATELTEEQYKLLQEKRSRTEEERLSERKKNLNKKYNIEVVPALHKLDQEGWHPQILMHYYLTHDSRFVRMRDHKHLAGHIERGEGKVCPQDMRLMSLPVELMKRLGILEFATSGRQWSKHSPEVKQVAKDLLWRYRQAIKDVLGITVSRHLVEENPIRLIQYLLGKMGIRLKSSQQRNEDGKREWVYQGWEYKSNLERHSSLREPIFAAWRERDQEELEWQLFDEEAAAAKLEGLPAPFTSSAPIQKSAVTEISEPAPPPELSHSPQPVEAIKPEFDSKNVSSYDTKVSYQFFIKDIKPTVTSKQSAMTSEVDQPETAPFKQGALVRWAGKAAEFVITWCGNGIAAVRDASGQAFNAPTDELRLA